MRKLMMLAVLLAAGCEPMTTVEGCTIYQTEIMRAHTDACVRAYYEERARRTGGTVTKCFGEGNSVTCVTE